MPVPSRRDTLVRPAAPHAPAVPSPGPVQAPPPQTPAAPFTPIQLQPAKAKPARSASAAGRPPRPRRASAAWPKLDVAAAMALGAVSVAAAVSLPQGPLRLALALPMLLFVPGYLLLQAFAVPAATGSRRGWQALASLGISPAVLGLLALLTSIVEGGFRLGAILAVTALGCAALGSAALVRRRALAHGSAAPKPAESAQAATAKTGPARP